MWQKCDRMTLFCIVCWQLLLQFNPLLHRLFLDHDNFLFLDNIEKIKKNLCKVLNTFKIIMENGAFASEQILHFP